MTPFTTAVAYGAAATARAPASTVVIVVVAGGTSVLPDWASTFSPSATVTVVPLMFTSSGRASSEPLTVNVSVVAVPPRNSTRSAPEASRIATPLPLAARPFAAHATGAADAALSITSNSTFGTTGANWLASGAPAITTVAVSRPGPPFRVTESAAPVTPDTVNASSPAPPSICRVCGEKFGPLVLRVSMAKASLPLPSRTVTASASGESRRVGAPRTATEANAPVALSEPVRAVVAVERSTVARSGAPGAFVPPEKVTVPLPSVTVNVSAPASPFTARVPTDPAVVTESSPRPAFNVVALAGFRSRKVTVSFAAPRLTVTVPKRAASNAKIPGASADRTAPPATDSTRGVPGADAVSSRVRLLPEPGAVSVRSARRLAREPPPTLTALTPPPTSSVVAAGTLMMVTVSAPAPRAADSVAVPASSSFTPPPVSRPPSRGQAVAAVPGAANVTNSTAALTAKRLASIGATAVGPPARVTVTRSVPPLPTTVTAAGPAGTLTASSPSPRDKSRDRRFVNVNAPAAGPPLRADPVSAKLRPVPSSESSKATASTPVTATAPPMRDSSPVPTWTRSPALGVPLTAVAAPVDSRVSVEVPARTASSGPEVDCTVAALPGASASRVRPACVDCTVTAAGTDDSTATSASPEYADEPSAEPTRSDVTVMAALSPAPTVRTAAFAPAPPAKLAPPTATRKASSPPSPSRLTCTNRPAARAALRVSLPSPARTVSGSVEADGVSRRTVSPPPVTTTSEPVAVTANASAAAVPMIVTASAAPSSAVGTTPPAPAAVALTRLRSRVTSVSPAAASVVERVTVSAPPWPLRRSLSKDAVILSVNAPVTATLTSPPAAVTANCSSAAEPLTTRVSVPAPPSITKSAPRPACQVRLSSPSPPRITSRPAPPARMSSPAPPRSVSSPSPPSSRSLPAPPSKLTGVGDSLSSRSSPSPPARAIVSGRNVPTRGRMRSWSRPVPKSPVILVTLSKICVEPNERTRSFSPTSVPAPSESIEYASSIVVGLSRRRPASAPTFSRRALPSMRPSTGASSGDSTR